MMGGLGGILLVAVITAFLIALALAIGAQVAYEHTDDDICQWNEVRAAIRYETPDGPETRVRCVSLDAYEDYRERGLILERSEK